MTTVLTGRRRPTHLPPTTAQLVETGTRRMPALESRLQRAEELVLSGKVLARIADRPRQVRSQSNPRRVYEVDAIAKLCSCYDRTEGHAPHGYCKHILAVAMEDRILADDTPTRDPRITTTMLEVLVHCAQAGFAIVI